LGLESIDKVQQGPYLKEQGPIFSQYGTKKFWPIKLIIFTLFTGAGIKVVKFPINTLWGMGNGRG